MTTDLLDGALVAWTDHRNSATSGLDIYIQRLAFDGRVATGVPGVAERDALVRAAVPNPAFEAAVVQATLTESVSCSVTILDVVGRQVRTLMRVGVLAPGRHEWRWDLQDDSGRRVPAGVYFVRLRRGDAVDLRRVAVLK
jgi:hypothetical protein